MCNRRMESAVEQALDVLMAIYTIRDALSCPLVSTYPVLVNNLGDHGDLVFVFTAQQENNTANLNVALERFPSHVVYTTWRRIQEEYGAPLARRRARIHVIYVVLTQSTHVGARWVVHTHVGLPGLHCARASVDHILWCAERSSLLTAPRCIWAGVGVHVSGVTAVYVSIFRGTDAHTTIGHAHENASYTPTCDNPRQWCALLCPQRQCAESSKSSRRRC